MKIKVLVPMALAFIAVINAAYAGQPTPAEDRQAALAGEQVAERVLAEVDFVRLASRINESKAETNTIIRRSMLNGILRATTSNELLKLENYGKVVIPSRVKAGKMMAVEGGNVVKQDLFIKRGRAAWVLEKLLDCELPTVTEETSDFEMRKFRFEAFYKVEESFLPSSKLIETSGLPMEERLSLANGTNTLGVILARLTKDPDVQVRRAVAANPKSPVFVLGQLRDFDADSEVRMLALKNLERSRRFAD